MRLPQTKEATRNVQMFLLTMVFAITCVIGFWIVNAMISAGRPCVSHDTCELNTSESGR